jgi:prepilin-type N-terminal cleavage/methylation domain-containing protein
MLNRLRRREKGFTLIELLIVVAIIGIIAALLIPNFLDALQKAKQKRTVGDMRNVGSAMFSWLTDQVGAASAGSSATQVSLSTYAAAAWGDVTKRLVTDHDYIQQVPLLDAWKGTYAYYLNTADPLAPTVMAIASEGRAIGLTGTYVAAAFDPTDYDQDIIWADGFFVRWPQKIQ